MDWKAFLEQMSDRWRLTPDQREVFGARLADENLTRVKLKLRLNSGSV
jgi:hypothetical protein